MGAALALHADRHGEAVNHAKFFEAAGTLHDARQHRSGPDRHDDAATEPSSKVTSYRIVACAAVI